MIHYILASDLVYMFTSHALERISERVSAVKSELESMKIDPRSPQAKLANAIRLVALLDRTLVLAPSLSGMAGLVAREGALLGEAEILEQDAGFIKKDTMVLMAKTFISKEMAADTYPDVIKLVDGKIYVRSDIGDIYERTPEHGKGPKIIREADVPSPASEVPEQCDTCECTGEKPDVHD